MPTVDVPGVGPVEKKWVWGGLAVAGSIAALYWFRRRNQSASAPDATIDPLTGLPYSAENQPATGYVNPNPVQSVIDSTGAVTTNAEWTADVIGKLGNIGMDAGFVGAVLGKYLASQPLTLEEAAVVRTAWAFSGKPPQGPDNFTLSSGSSQPGGGTVPPPHDPAPGTTYVTKQGDTITGIAYYFGRAVQEIQQANPNMHQGVNDPLPAGLTVVIPPVYRTF